MLTQSNSFVLSVAVLCISLVMYYVLHYYSIFNQVSFTAILHVILSLIIMGSHRYTSHLHAHQKIRNIQHLFIVALLIHTSIDLVYNNYFNLDLQALSKLPISTIDEKFYKVIFQRNQGNFLTYYNVAVAPIYASIICHTSFMVLLATSTAILIHFYTLLKLFSSIGTIWVIPIEVLLCHLVCIVCVRTQINSTIDLDLIAKTICDAFPIRISCSTASGQLFEHDSSLILPEHREMVEKHHLFTSAAMIPPDASVNILECASENSSTTFRSLVAPIQNMAGEILGHATMSLEVPLNFQRRGSTTEENYRALVENISEIIVKIDKQFNIQFMNREFCEFTPTNCTNVKFTDLFNKENDSNATSELKSTVEKLLLDLFETKKSHTFEWSRTFNSQKLYYSTRLTPIVKKDLVTAAISLTSDITDRKKAIQSAISEEQAKIASKSKSDFIASMSHELRNPLHAILCTIQLLSATDNITNTQMNYIEDLNENAKLLKATLSDVLDMSKIESGTIELMETSESMLEIVETCADIFSAQATAKGLEIFSFVDSNIQTALLADKTRLLQILSNFTTNAIKFTRKGHIFLRAILKRETEVDQTIELSCVDTGIGIKEEDTCKLFKPWIQVSSDSSSNSSSSSSSNSGEEDLQSIHQAHGYGLGLSLCEKLVKLMKGEIFVQTVYGQGSTFGVTVTLKKNSLSLPSQETFSTWYNSSLYKVALVMHENAQFNEVLTRYLNSIGIQLIHYSLKPVQAIEIVEYYTKQMHQSIVLIIDEPFKANSALLQVASEECKIITLINKFNLIHDTSDKNGPVKSLLNNSNNRIDTPLAESNFVVNLKKPLKFTRFMNVLSGRRNSVSSSLLWDPNYTSKLMNNNSSGNKEGNGGKGSAGNQIVNIDMLLVEDNPINQKVAAKLLTQLGVKSVDIANNGVEALAKIQNRDLPYSLVLMDLQMPKMDGISCTRAIRVLSDESKRNTPIVALTANAWQDSISECLKAGMNDVLTKPVTLENLMLKLQQHASINI